MSKQVSIERKWPTEYLSRLFPLMRDHLRALPDPVISAPNQHKLDGLLDRGEETLVLFLQYPTRRIADMAIWQWEQVESLVRPMLSRNLEPGETTVAERIKSLLADWRLAIQLKVVCQELENAPPEALN